MKQRIAAVAAVWMLTTATVGAQCACDEVFFEGTPITELGEELYLGLYAGGLYPGGEDRPPQAHAQEGRRRAEQSVQPLDVQGQPSEDGKVVLVSIGMCNTSQEFCSASGLPPCARWSFMGRAELDPRVDTTALRIVNGAHGGQSADAWLSSDPTEDTPYDFILDNWIAPDPELSELQVQAAWLKVANAGPTDSLLDPDPDALDLLADMATIVREMKLRYPNLQIVFVSSRIYAGYADPLLQPLNPEPFAYESAFAVKWLIEAQIEQVAGGPIDPAVGDLDYRTDVAPWLAWGPYAWADGDTPREDGLRWLCGDFAGDCTHPGRGAESKVGRLLLEHLLQTPFSAPWFRSPTP